LPSKVPELGVDALLLRLNIEPVFDGLRRAPRFQQLLRRVGLAG